MLNSKLIFVINITLLNFYLSGQSIFDPQFVNKSRSNKNDLETILRHNNDVLIEQNVVNLNLNTCGEQWIPYTNNKCIKVLTEKGSIDEAKGNCSEFGSTLITIQSNEEQTVLNQILQNYKNISDYVWIGLEMSENNSYKWLDGNDVKYENWAQNANKNEKCVQMSLALENPTLGKWTDVFCDKKGLIVCQKNPVINSNVVTENQLKNQENALNDKMSDSELKRIMVKGFNEQQSQLGIQYILLNNLIKATEKHENTINDMTNKMKILEQLAIPIGFIYTQLPNQSFPLQLWPNSTWIEVTQEYSGLFFRAEGLESEPFGKIQQANQSWISGIHLAGASYSSWEGWSYKKYTTQLKREMWVNVARGGERAVEFLKFYTTGGEVRPINTAIKIWKRIE